jgi:4-amino-4-deoxychorismate lyase
VIRDGDRIDRSPIADHSCFMFLVNGRRSDSVPAMDRGLNYGDGVFETLAARDGRCLLLNAHLARLFDGLARLRFARVPERPQLEDEAGALAAEVGHGVVKILVTRGPGGRGYRAESGTTPTRVLSAQPWDRSVTTRREQGVAIRSCKLRLAPEVAALAGVKHLNRLPQVLARLEWNAECEEGLLLDEQDRLVEGTMSNVFLVHRGVLVTPELVRCGLAGVMRAQVLGVAASRSIPMAVRAVPAAEAAQASEIFLTNSVIGVWPVRRFGDTEMAIGPVTRALQSALDEQSPPVLA